MQFPIHLWNNHAAMTMVTYRNVQLILVVLVLARVSISPNDLKIHN